VLRKGVSRSMAISSRDKARRSAADALLARNKAILMAATHSIAGIASPVDIERYDLSAEHVAALDAAAASRAAVNERRKGRSQSHASATSTIHTWFSSGKADSTGDGTHGWDEDGEGDESEEEEGEGHGRVTSQLEMSLALGANAAHEATLEQSGKQHGAHRSLHKLLRYESFAPREGEVRASHRVLHTHPAMCRILSYLTHKDIAQSSSVCRDWREFPLHSDLMLWRGMGRSGGLPASCRAALWRNVAAAMEMVPPHVLTVDSVVSAAAASHALGAASIIHSADLHPVARLELPLLTSALRTVIRNGEIGKHVQSGCRVIWGSLLMSRLCAWLAFPILFQDENGDNKLAFDRHTTKTCAAYISGLVGLKDKVFDVGAGEFSHTHYYHHTRDKSVAAVYNDVESDSDEREGDMHGHHSRSASAIARTETATLPLHNELGSWIAGRKLRARTLLKLYAHSATAASSILSGNVLEAVQGELSFSSRLHADIGSNGSHAQGEKRTATSYTFPPRFAMDTSIAMASLPRVSYVCFNPQTPNEKTAFDSQHIQGDTTPPLAGSYKESAVANTSTAVFNAFATAGHANEKVGELVNKIKTLCASIKHNRMLVNMHLQTIKDAAENDVPLDADISTKFASACEDVAGLEASLQEQLNVHISAAAAAHEACCEADRLFISSVIESRRAHATQLAAAWLHRVLLSVADKSVNHSHSHARAYVHPATGVIVPACGITVPSLEAGPRGHSYRAELACEVERLAEHFASTLPFGMGDPLAKSSLLQLYSDMPPLPSLPVRLQKLLIQQSCEDFDDAEEVALGLDTLPVPAVLSCETDEMPAGKPQRFELGPPAESASMLNPGVPTCNMEGACASLQSAVNRLGDAWQKDGIWTNVVLIEPPYASQHGLIDADVRRTFGELDSALRVFGWSREEANSPGMAVAQATWTRVAAVETPASEASEESTNVSERHMTRLASLLHGDPFFASSALNPQSTSHRKVRRANSDASISLSMEEFAKLVPGSASATAEQYHEMEFLSKLLPLTFFRPDATGGEARLSPGHVAVLRRRLRKVLVAHSAFDRDVGYCQGQNFMSSVLLVHMDQCSTFWTLESLMNGLRYRFTEIFASGLKRVAASFNTLSVLLKKHIPPLAKHLVAEKVVPDMYAAGWIMTCFSSIETLPLPYVVALWDVFLLDGWKALFRVIVALLESVSQDLCMGDFAIIVQFLHKFPLHRLPASPAAMIRRANRFKITTRTLNTIEDKYESGQEHVPAAAVLKDVSLVRVNSTESLLNSPRSGSIALLSHTSIPSVDSISLTPVLAPEPARALPQSSPSFKAAHLTGEHIAALLSGAVQLAPELLDADAEAVLTPAPAPRKQYADPYGSEEDEDNTLSPGIGGGLMSTYRIARAASRVSSPSSVSSAIDDGDMAAALGGGVSDSFGDNLTVHAPSTTGKARRRSTATPAPSSALPVVAATPAPKSAAAAARAQQPLSPTTPDDLMFVDYAMPGAKIREVRMSGFGDIDFGAGGPLEEDMHASIVDLNHNLLERSAADREQSRKGAVVVGKPTSSSAGMPVPPAKYAAAIYGDDPLA
jgi:hypothetical protein